MGMKPKIYIEVEYDPYGVWNYTANSYLAETNERISRATWDFKFMERFRLRQLRKDTYYALARRDHAARVQRGEIQKKRIEL